ncbi:hypothetical protein Rsub_04366 [Raphidocelis subcapitata]|uniref:Uncharacterized protein n=1 Tax=Raphidocelis subcapitata TaxID=307507 RepID=A0A2V0NVG6_9CHLO|nr:hypothetical protein Rsub_04366 [Raphidocelis subcapitata]|eukprot:GBF91626.1 hypothetical protein Rsub_04366 [Raphidocelis subcapitata]
MTSRPGEISLEDIAAARNEALTRQGAALGLPRGAGDRDDPEAVAASLDAAHRDAVALKRAADAGAGGGDDGAGAGGGADDATTLADKADAAAGRGDGGSSGGGDDAAEGLRAGAAAALGAARGAAAEAGERLAQGVATADQAATTAARDAVGGAAAAVAAAGGAAAEAAARPGEAAAGLVEKVREGLKSLIVGAEPEAPAEGGGDADPLEARVADVERLRVEAERDQARRAYEAAAAKLGVRPDPGGPAAIHPPAEPPDTPSGHDLVHATTATGSPVIHSPTETGRPRFPTIFSPIDPDARAASDARAPASDAPGGIDLSREPPSQGAGSTPPYGVGDPAAQAGGVATGMRVAHAVTRTVKEALGLGGPPSAAPPPAGAAEPDADVAVGDFATLNARVSEARARAASEAEAGRGGGEVPAAGGTPEAEAGRRGDAAGAAGAGDAAGAGVGGGGSGGASDIAPGVDSATRSGPSSGGGGGGGALGLLGGLISDIASKVHIASNTEELLAGGPGPEAADISGPGGTGGGGGAGGGAGPEASETGQQQGQAGSRGPEPGAAPAGGRFAHSTVKEGDAFVRRPEAPRPGEGGGGVAEALARGWDELKRGGAKAPWVDTQGETQAPQDVTSNVERSRHLEDPLQRRIYDAETYRVSPGAQSAPDQAATDAAKAAARGGGGVEGGEGAAPSEAVAGDRVTHTGAQPHGKPPGPTQRQPDRFGAGGGGIFSSIGTGSAAPYRGDDSALRAQSAHSAFLAAAAAAGAGDAAADVRASFEPEAAPAAAGSEAAAASGGGGGGGGLLDSLAAAWRGVGRGSAKDPSGKEVKDEQQLLVRGDPSGHSHVVGNTLQEGLPAEQTEEQRPVNPARLVDKAERFGRAAADLASGPPRSEEEAAGSLWGKDASGRPDGTQEFLRRSARDAAAAAARAPQAAASAAAAAAEIAGGVAEHAATKTAETARNLAATREPRSDAQADAEIKAGLDAAPGGGEGGAAPQPQPQPQRVSLPGAMGESYGRQLEALAQGGAHPAVRRETLGDKVLNPTIGDPTDETAARDIARSYREYKREHAPPPEGAPPAAPAPGGPHPLDRPHDPIAHMESSKREHASKLPSGPGTDQDPSHLARDSSGRRVGAPDRPVVHGSKEKDPREAQEAARRAEEEDEKIGREGARRAFGLPQLPEDAAASLPGGPQAKEKAAQRAREQLEGRRVTLGQAVEQGARAAASALGRGGEEHPTAARAREAVVARAGVGGGDEGRRQGGSEAAGEAPPAPLPSRSGEEASGGGGGLAGALEGMAEGVGRAIGRALGAAERVGGGVARDDAADAARCAREERAGGGAGGGGDGDEQSSGGREGGEKGAAAEAAAGRARDAAGRAREEAEAAGGAAVEGASAAGEAISESARAAAAGAGEAAGRARETGRQWAGEAAAAGRAAAEGAEGVAEAADERLEEAAKGARDEAAALGREGGSLLGALAGAAKAIVGAMAGPLEREGAFDESAAGVTGAPVTAPSEPAGAEQLDPEAARATDQARGAAVRGYAARARASDPASGRRAEEKMREAAAGAEAPAGEAASGGGGGGGEEEFGLEERVQTAADDTAAAAGLIAGHASAAAAGASEAAARGPLGFLLPEGEPDAPAEPYTNTEDLLAARAAEAARRAEEDAARGPARV